jgi:hypothetical protein
VSATIEVKKSAGGDPMTFAVAVREDESETRHDVTLSRAYLARVAPGASAEQAIEAAFRFLLDREPKEAILARFDVSVISRYFPQFETRLPDYLR